MRIMKNSLALATCVALGAAGYAAVIVDDNGVGFVGKGDVQDAFGWNNAQFQQCLSSTPANPATDAGCLRFSMSVVAVTMTEHEWTCVRSGGQTQERLRTITTTTNSTLVSAAVARSRNQVTGINLNGGVPATTSVVTSEGPPLHSCPTHWTIVPGSITEETIDLGSSKTLTVKDTRTDTTHVLNID